MEYQNFNLYGYKNFILSRQVLKKNNYINKKCNLYTSRHNKITKIKF